MKELLIEKNLDDLTRVAVDTFVKVANDAISAHGRFTVALAGGSTPRALYSRLASDDHRDRIQWKHVDFFFGDERNVAPDSVDSNFRMANETLLQPLGIEDAQIFRWQTELPDPSAVADRYQDLVRTHGPFDLVILGLGADAHTASLFPNTAALGENERLAVTNAVPQLDELRFTITFPVINAAANVVFLVSGPEKAEAVRNVREGEFRPEKFPAQAVRPESGDLFWLLDEEAAALLTDR